MLAFIQEFSAQLVQEFFTHPWRLLFSTLVPGFLVADTISGITECWKERKILKVKCWRSLVLRLLFYLSCVVVIVSFWPTEIMLNLFIVTAIIFILWMRAYRHARHCRSHDYYHDRYHDRTWDEFYDWGERLLK